VLFYVYFSYKFYIGLLNIAALGNWIKSRNLYSCESL